MASQDWLDKDFYAILGVSSDADAATIKKTYRKLARKLHPDQNAGDTAAEAKFKEIGEAYSVLSDTEQRQQYDQLRAMTPRRRPVHRRRRRVGGWVRGPLLRHVRRPGRDPHPLLDEQQLDQRPRACRTCSASLFGQAGGSYPGGSTYGGYDTFGAPRGPRKGADVQARTNLSFRDAVAGQTVTLEAADGQRITTRIPPGVRDGQKIRLRGKGSRGDAGADPGDLILTVTVEKHPVFGRDGDNLTVDLPVTFPEAALGATVSVPTLDGTPVRVKIAPGTPSGRVLRVKGRGVKRGDKSGDLLAKVQVVVPQRLTDAGREALEAMQADEAGHDPRAELFERAQA